MLAARGGSYNRVNSLDIVVSQHCSVTYNMYVLFTQLNSLRARISALAWRDDERHA